MASILKRGPYQWQATIRRKGYPTQTKTFETKSAADAWATIVESEMKRHVFIDKTEVERTTLGELLTRYGEEESPKKLSCRTELVTIRRLLKHPLADRSLASLRSTDFAKYRDERILGGAANNSVRLELALLSTMFSNARKEWSIPVDNFILNISKPTAPPGRERRLIDDEEKRLLAAARQSQATSLELCIILAIETGMREGNIVDLHWEQIDFKQKVIFLDRTKNGSGLTVPLSVKAEAALKAYRCESSRGRITRFYDAAGLGAAFRRARKIAGIDGLNFHDLRHEAASRLAPLVPTATLCKLMGWKSIAMAMRYYNATPQELLKIRRAAESARVA